MAPQRLLQCSTALNDYHIVSCRFNALSKAGRITLDLSHLSLAVTVWREKALKLLDGGNNRFI